MQRFSFACDGKRELIISRASIWRAESHLIGVLASDWILPQLINSQFIPILLKEVARFIGFWVEVSPYASYPIIQGPIMDDLLSLQGLPIQDVKIVDLSVCDIAVSEICQQCFLGIRSPLCHSTVI